jgi:hypothetical protein
VQVHFLFVLVACVPLITSTLTMYFQVPRISISPAPPDEPAVEPYSPFAFIPQVSVDNDGFRPVLLTPPLSVHHLKLEGSRKHDTRGIGLESQRFQELLKATRERNSVGLRKELAMKIQKNKHAERRAIFLSKLQAPPSPTAVMTPNTPPDSPAVFHYTLPSPGLTSPFTVFKSVDKDTCQGWVETVYFEQQDTYDDCTNDATPAEKRKSVLRIPSLEQISARMKPSTINPSKSDVDSYARDLTSAINTTSPHTRPLIGVGRLRMPLRASRSQPHATLAPPSQASSEPMLRMTTVVDSTANSASRNTKLTETNLNAFNVRGQKAHDMLCTLRRRTSPDRADEECKRYSAPAEMTCRPRIGFAHPVLALPGGF